jgi:hypothetical protein
MFDHMFKHYLRWFDVKELDRQMLVYTAMFSYFYLKTNTTPYVRPRGDTGKGKTRITKVVGDTCFYPLTSSGASSFSAMARTQERWRGTLIIDEADLKGDKGDDIIKYLNLGFEDGQYYGLSDKQNPTRQEFFNPFCPKILSMRESFRDNATEGRCMSIECYQTLRTDIPPILGKEYEAEAQQLRNELAIFALNNWGKVDGEKLLDFRHLDIEPRLRQLAMPLSIIFQIWPEGIENFEEYLLRRQAEIKRDRASSWEGSLFNATYSLATGESDLSSLREFEGYYRDGQLQAVTSKMIGHVLGIQNTTTINKGLKSIGIEPDRKHVHVDGKSKLVRLYSVPNEKAWREITERYHYDPDNPSPNIEIPEILKGKTFISMPGEGQGVTGVTGVTAHNTRGGGKTGLGDEIPSPFESIFD